MRFGDVIICEKAKDGGPKSRVEGYWLFRHKKLFTIALLRFGEGSREAYHSHAFNAISWLLSGCLEEWVHGGRIETYEPSLKPIVTPRERLHKVYGEPGGWVLTFRGPWADTWQEVDENDELITLTHNRVRVA